MGMWTSSLSVRLNDGKTSCKNNDYLTFYVTFLDTFIFSINLKPSEKKFPDVTRSRTIKLSDKDLSESLVVRKFSIQLNSISRRKMLDPLYQIFIKFVNKEPSFWSSKVKRNR